MKDSRSSKSLASTDARSTLAIRCPTCTTAGERLPSGHTYLMLLPRVTLRELITEKVRAELRKARAAGLTQSTIADLVEGEIIDDDGEFWLYSPYAEAIARRNAINAFERGVFTVVVDRLPVEYLDELVEITRNTTIAFILPVPVVA